jgi:hypothetical protein
VFDSPKITTQRISAKLDTFRPLALWDGQNPRTLIGSGDSASSKAGPYR